MLLLLLPYKNPCHPWPTRVCCHTLTKPDCLAPLQNSTLTCRMCQLCGLHCPFRQNAQKQNARQMLFLHFPFGKHTTLFPFTKSSAERLCTLQFFVSKSLTQHLFINTQSGSFCRETFSHIHSIVIVLSSLICSVGKRYL